MCSTDGSAVERGDAQPIGTAPFGREVTFSQRDALAVDEETEHRLFCHSIGENPANRRMPRQIAGQAAAPRAIPRRTYTL